MFHSTTEQYKHKQPEIKSKSSISSSVFFVFLFLGEIWIIWRMTRGLHVWIMWMDLSLLSFSPSRRRPPSDMAIVSSLTSVLWAPCFCFCKPYSAQWSTLLWYEHTHVLFQLFKHSQACYFSDMSIETENLTIHLTMCCLAMWQLIQDCI